MYLLHQKIIGGEIAKHFTYKDIERAIVETGEINVGPIPQTEKIVKNLLHYYLEHPANANFKYAFTDYGIKFIKLIDNKLYSPYKEFPLRKTFKKFADFKSKSIKTIEDFKAWYELQFHNSSKQTILDHLEALQDVVNTYIKELNLLLNSKDENMTQLVAKFAHIFEDVGSKSKEIKDTLKLGTSLSHEIDKTVSFFYSKVQDFKHPENDSERLFFQELSEQYHQSLHIKKEIQDFFEKIDYRLKQLIERSLYASVQLKNLQNNFKNHSEFRINVKRFLKFTLDQASYEKDDFVSLPKTYPLKYLPAEYFKYIELRYYERFGIKKNIIVPVTYDERYKELENKKIQKDLLRQENTAKWVRQYKDRLKQEKEIEFTEHFYDILKEENDTEIALGVGFELFQYANDHPDYKIEVKREFQDYPNTENIVVWKMKIAEKD